MATATQTTGRTIKLEIIDGQQIATIRTDKGTETYSLEVDHTHPSMTVVYWTPLFRSIDVTETYTVRIGQRDHAGFDGCTCPDHKYRGHRRPCKHVAATLAMMGKEVI